MECWVGNYIELYGGTNFVLSSALDKVERLPTLLQLDDVPTKELSKAIIKITSDKASGQDSTPAEVFKCDGSQLLVALQQLLCRCWDERSVTEEMRDSHISIPYKNKGDRSDWNNYCGISLLCTAGKLLTWVALVYSSFLSGCTQNPNVVFASNNWRWIWYSCWGNSRRNVEGNNSLYS